MNVTHTTGPWQATEGCSGSVIRDSLDRIVATLPDVSDCPGADLRGGSPDASVTRVANAKLIAAAPILLQACLAALDRDDIRDGELGLLIHQAVVAAGGDE
jgi:hypothetical protein